MIILIVAALKVNPFQIKLKSSKRKRRIKNLARVSKSDQLVEDPDDNDNDDDEYISDTSDDKSNEEESDEYDSDGDSTDDNIPDDSIKNKKLKSTSKESTKKQTKISIARTYDIYVSIKLKVEKGKVPTQQLVKALKKWFS